ncbi:hypothetical protein NDU88_001966 [Pleurodeles waltl]|uniref:Uncharacterized protein n=1 Tax=Pleurodeles waltl TaxID=8319 RepID=A0AAV7U8D0_PLEWA|nr:hypothetical protein NDU88_001966 [Pleurodeles waltl]
MPAGRARSEADLGAAGAEDAHSWLAGSTPVHIAGCLRGERTRLLGSESDWAIGPPGRAGEGVRRTQPVINARRQSEKGSGSGRGWNRGRAPRLLYVLEGPKSTERKPMDEGPVALDEGGSTGAALPPG